MHRFSTTLYRSLQKDKNKYTVMKLNLLFFLVMHFFLLIVLVLYLVVFHTSILILRSVVWVYFLFIFLMIFHFIYPFLNKWINLKFVFIFLFFLIHPQNALHPQKSLHTCNGNRFWTKQNILCNYESLFATDHDLHIN